MSLSIGSARDRQRSIPRALRQNAEKPKRAKDFHRIAPLTNVDVADVVCEDCPRKHVFLEGSQVWHLEKQQPHALPLRRLESGRKERQMLTFRSHRNSQAASGRL
jgi:hypothetical protein